MNVLPRGNCWKVGKCPLIFAAPRAIPVTFDETLRRSGTVSTVITSREVKIQESNPNVVFVFHYQLTQRLCDNTSQSNSGFIKRPLKLGQTHHVHRGARYLHALSCCTLGFVLAETRRPSNIGDRRRAGRHEGWRSLWGQTETVGRRNARILEVSVQGRNSQDVRGSYKTSLLFRSW